MTDISSYSSTSTSQHKGSAATAAELHQEQEYMDGLYTRLDELIDSQQIKLNTVKRTQAEGTHQSRSERDAFANLHEDRLATLNSIGDKIAFGRVDTKDGQRHYIGRIGLHNAQLEPILMDWRAPEAGVFYQATSNDDKGLSRRRHLFTEGRTVEAIEDEVFDLDLLESEDVDNLTGSAALLAAVNAERTGQMGDIVGTIQQEQDDIIRADRQGIRVVQGGPGTGKTAVALHRAAYLLYTYRNQLASSGVLIVGPSTEFMHYIDRVLPALGETGVVMASLGSLLPGVDSIEDPDQHISDIKGRIQWKKIIDQAVKNRQKLPLEDLKFSIDGYTLILSREKIQGAQKKAWSDDSSKTYNQARIKFLNILLEDLTDQLKGKIKGDSTTSAASAKDLSYADQDVRTHRDIRVGLNLLWMPMTEQQLVSELLSNEAVLSAAAGDHLSHAEQKQVIEQFIDLNPNAQKFSLSPSAVWRWTESDIPLLDHASTLVGSADSASSHTKNQQKQDTKNAKKAIENMTGDLEDKGVEGIITADQLVQYNQERSDARTVAEAAAADKNWTYGHIVVDEAQELTPMQWNMLFKRNPTKSMTVVGDIAQKSHNRGAQSWADALGDHIDHHDKYNEEKLTVNYRTPAHISNAAVDMAKAQDVDVVPPRAVRQGDYHPSFVYTTEDKYGQEIINKIEEKKAKGRGGLFAVIVPDSYKTAIKSELSQKYGSEVSSGAGSTSSPISVLSPRESKGLEFDEVVIVEPGRILEDSQSIGDLYVAMTRPTQRLDFITTGEVPPGLEKLSVESMT